MIQPSPARQASLGNHMEQALNAWATQNPGVTITEIVGVLEVMKSNALLQALSKQQQQSSIVKAPFIPPNL